jgi:hypothetical protein
LVNLLQEYLKEKEINYENINKEIYENLLTTIKIEIAKSQLIFMFPFCIKTQILVEISYVLGEKLKKQKE